LRGLTKVEVLNLSNCDRLTDFTPVQEMTGLRELNLKGCPLTAEEIAALREALPTTVVIFFPKNAVSGFEPKTQ
jgi:hypothetical protein